MMLHLGRQRYSGYLILGALPSLVFSTNVILPPTPTGSTVYNLPGVYGALGDIFTLNSNFYAPNGTSGGNAAVSMIGQGTFILSNGFIVNKTNGGATGAGAFRAILLAKAGGISKNYGTVTGINSTVTDNFGMSATSKHTGRPDASSYVFNYGNITMAGVSTDGMNASGTLAARSYAYNHGTINVADNNVLVSVSNWVTEMSGVGNGIVVNEATGIINATSKIGSRGSNGLFGGYNITNFSGTGLFNEQDQQMINRGTINSAGDSHGIYFWGNVKSFALNEGTISINGRGHGVYLDNVDNVNTGANSGIENSATGIIT